MKREIVSINTKGSADITWDVACEAWTLFEGRDFSLFQGKMPSDSKDEMHVHTDSEQFLYVLSGQATLEFEDKSFTVSPQQGVVIPQGASHRLINHSDSEVTFLVISTNGSREDRLEN